MKSATNSPSSERPLALPEVPPNDVTAGIDWARDDHAACIVDGRGRKVATTMVEHTTTGLRDLVAFLGRHGVDEVAIERPDGPVIDALLDAGLTVVVISPNQVKNLRGRYGSAGNKDDRFDARTSVPRIEAAGWTSSPRPSPRLRTPASKRSSPSLR